MLKRLLLLTTLSLLLSGCFMGPMVLLGPAASGFSTASIVQTSFTTTANYMVKKSTGKTIGQHAFDTITKDTLQQSFMPNRTNVLSKNKVKSK